MTPEEALLIERAVSAHRERSVDGAIKSHPAWYDLNAEGRRAVFEETLKQRTAEQAIHREGHSTTVSALLARLSQRAGPR